MRRVLVLAPHEVPPALAAAARSLAGEAEVVSDEASLGAALASGGWALRVAAAPGLADLPETSLNTLAAAGAYLLSLQRGPVPPRDQLPGAPLVLVGEVDPRTWGALLEAAPVQPEWSAKVQHDLRGPISNVLGFADRLLRLLERGDATPERLRDGLERIARNARCGLDLLADLSLVRALRSPGRRSPAPTSFLQPLLRAAEALQPELDRRGTNLELLGDEEGGAPRVPGDVLERALLRLLQDLVKLAGRGGTVRVSLEGPGSATLLLSVTSAAGRPGGSSVPQEGLDTLLARELLEAVGGGLRVQGPGVTYRLSASPGEGDPASLR